MIHGLQYLEIHSELVTQYTVALDYYSIKYQPATKKLAYNAINLLDGSALAVTYLSL